MNEETLKLSVVVPLLKDIGLNPKDLVFEKTFSIQLGRGVYTIKGEEVSVVSGRADILCMMDNVPLFIIEVKAEGQTFSDADRRQGLSYARLLDPMAPFVLLTNGKNTKLYDTFTGMEISIGHGEPLLHGFTADIATEMRLRHEALSHFIGYSTQNILCFCNSHNDISLKPFIADESEEISNQLSKKYIPQAYIPRIEIETAFRSFLKESGKYVFPVIGDSGVGKTNLLCHLVQTNEDKPFMFYSGSLLSHSLLSVIASDFNLEFSSQDQGLQILKKISMLFRSQGQSFVLFLDAVDEWDAADRVEQLSQLVTWFVRLGLKLVISCKTQPWQEMVIKNGISTPLAEHLFNSAPVLMEYSRSELGMAVEMYSHAFGVKVRNVDNRQVTTNPLALRVAFDVSCANKTELDLLELSRETLTKYLQLRLAVSADPHRSMRFLVEISRCLLNRNRHQVSETELQSDLHLSLGETVPKELFHLDLLYRYIDDLGRSFVGFYFSMVRDHLIATHVLKLPCNRAALQSAIRDGLLSTYIGECAFGYFLRTGTDKEQRACIEELLASVKQGEFDTLPRNFAWHGAWLSPDIKDYYQEEILRGLLACFKANDDNLTISEQVLDGIKLMSGTNVEEILTEMFDVLHRNPNKPFIGVSHRIASLLSKGSNREVSKRLIVMAMNVMPCNGYVRRYIVESLQYRDGFDRRDLFLSLLVDPDPNVRAWVRGWYRSIENVALRDQILDIFDNHPDPEVVMDVGLALEGSQFDDTAQQIYQRLILGNMDETVFKWTCRVLASLKFTQVIPLLMQIIKSSINSECAGHALIALGDLRAREAMQLIFEIVRSEQIDIGKNQHWLIRAFHQIAEKADFIALSNLLSDNPGSSAANLWTLILAGASDRQWDQIILEYIMNQKVDISLRRLVLQEWGYSYSKSNRNLQELVTLPDAILANLHSIVEQNNEMSSLALLLLINTNANLECVAEQVTRLFPTLSSKFDHRNLFLFRSERWTEFGQLIRPWLHRFIESDISSPQSAANCLELLRMVADHSTIDILNLNRQVYDNIFGKQFTDEIENRVRKGLGPGYF